MFSLSQPDFWRFTFPWSALEAKAGSTHSVTLDFNSAIDILAISISSDDVVCMLLSNKDYLKPRHICAIITNGCSVSYLLFS